MSHGPLLSTRVHSTHFSDHARQAQVDAIACCWLAPTRSSHHRKHVGVMFVRASIVSLGAHRAYERRSRSIVVYEGFVPRHHS